MSKRRIAAILLCLGAGASASVLGGYALRNEPLSTIFEFLTLVAACTGVALIVSHTVLNGRESRRLHAKLQKTEKALSTIAWRVEKVPDIAGTASATRKDIKALREQPSLLAPASPPPAALPKSPESAALESAANGNNVPGRGQGSAPRATDNAGPLSARIEPEKSEEAPCTPQADATPAPQELHSTTTVAFISSAEATRALSDHPHLYPVYPGTARGALAQHNIDTIIIDARAFHSGPWFAADRAQGTHLFVELWDIVRNFKTHGKLAIFLENKVPPAQFTHDLTSHCALVVTHAQPDLGFGEGVVLPPHINAAISAVRDTRPEDSPSPPPHNAQGEQ